MDIQLFRNEQFGQLRGMNIEGEPWFVGKDVAQVLGYSNSPKAIRDHVDDEDKRSERIVHPLGGVQQTTFINESGLYSLILSSKLPKAREFKRWVTAEVLPQIRRTGGYIPVKPEDDEKSILCKAVSILQRTLAEREELIEEQRPKVQFAEALTSSPGSILIRDLAKLLTQQGFPIGQTRLFAWMRRHGYLFQREARPIQKWVEQGLFDTSVTLIQTHHGTEERCTTKVTCKGQEYFVAGFLSGRFAVE